MAKPITPSDILDAAIAAEEATPVAVPAGTVVAAEADSYASLAAAHKPAKMSAHEYAVELHAKNGGKALAAGVIVTL